MMGRLDYSFLQQQLQFENFQERYRFPPGVKFTHLKCLVTPLLKTKSK